MVTRRHVLPVLLIVSVSAAIRHSQSHFSFRLLPIEIIGDLICRKHAGINFRPPPIANSLILQIVKFSSFRASAGGETRLLWNMRRSAGKITLPLMPSPEENSDAVSSPFNDVQENVRRFNEDEAVWRCFARKRARRKRLLWLLGLLDSQPPLTKKQLDDLDWLAAEREARPVRAIGTWIAP
jgi:hypothetical protein